MIACRAGVGESENRKQYNINYYSVVYYGMRAIEVEIERGERVACPPKKPGASVAA